MASEYGDLVELGFEGLDRFADKVNNTFYTVARKPGHKKNKRSNSCTLDEEKVSKARTEPPRERSLPPEQPRSMDYDARNRRMTESENRFHQGADDESYDDYNNYDSNTRPNRRMTDSENRFHKDGEADVRSAPGGRGRAVDDYDDNARPNRRMTDSENRFYQDGADQGTAVATRGRSMNGMNMNGYDNGGYQMNQMMAPMPPPAPFPGNGYGGYPPRAALGPAYVPENEYPPGYGPNQGQKQRPPPPMQMQRRGSSYSPPRRSKRDRNDSPRRRARSKSSNRDSLTTTVMGALAGGLLGTAAKKDSAWTTVAGAVVGGLGAREAEKFYERRRGRETDEDERRQRRRRERERQSEPEAYGYDYDYRDRRG